jgi:hypothetical protein
MRLMHYIYLDDQLLINSTKSYFAYAEERD